MKYPVLVLRNNEEKNYLFSIVDLPGCKVKAITIDEVPQAKTIEHHMLMSTAISPIWAVLDFDIVPYMGKSHKINVTLPELLIKQIDDRVAKSSDHKTRSGFIAMACIAELCH